MRRVICSLSNQGCHQEASGGRGFPPASMNVPPGFFRRKIQEIQNQKKSLAVLFPTYLLYLPGNFKF